MASLLKLLLGANKVLGTLGPKAAAIGVLLVLAGEVLQGHWDKLDADTAMNALLALGLLGARANLVTSKESGATEAAIKRGNT